MAWLAAVAVALPAAAQGTGATIETFAGGGGDPVALLGRQPEGVAVDGSGNVYIADSWNDRIRRVDSSGTVSTFALWGFTNPEGVAVDGSDVYIADTFNHRVLKVDSIARTIAVFAGTGTAGFGGDGGSATSSLLDYPRGLAVDGSGNVYIADQDNNRIRKVDSTGMISTFAGTGTGGFGGDGGSATSSLLWGPRGVAADGSGNVYIADTFNSRVRRVDSSGAISTFAGTGTRGFGGDGGAAISARLDGPDGVAADGSGNVYIADFGNDRIRRVDSSGNISTILAAPAVRSPRGVAVDGSGNVYVAELSRVRKVDALTNEVSTLASAGSYGFGPDGVAATSSLLAAPGRVAVDGSGNVYITDRDSHRVRKVAPSGIISTFAGTGMQGFDGDGGAATSARLQEPTGVAVDGSGNVYIAQGNNHRIRKVAPSGIISTFAGSGAFGFGGDGGSATSAQFTWPEGVAVDGSGNVYFATWGDARIRKVAPSGIISTFAGSSALGFGGDGGPAASAMLDSPRGVAVDSSGNVYIADRGNHRIRKVDPLGIISTFAGGGTDGIADGVSATSSMLRYPRGVAVDGSGNVYIADTGNHRVRKVDSAGFISTIAGTGIYGFSGDGGLATSSLLHFPQGVAVDGLGNVYIVDWGNNRIRRICVSPASCVRRPPVADAGVEQPEVPNAPPLVLVALQDAVLAGGQTARIGLGSAFQDPDDDVLVYSAVSSAPAVVLASVDGDALVLSGVSAGVATVTVSAVDPQGLSVEQTLEVTVGTVLSLEGDGEAVEGGTARLSVRLSTVRQVPTAFRWKVLEDADPATADADAGEHGDASGSGSIAAGETTATIEIDIADDADVERPREWLLVELLADAEDPVALGRTRATVVVLEGVCDRTPAVAAALVADGGCETATDAGLAALRSLSLQEAGVAALRSEDLAGLHGLQVLGLGGNALSELPAGLLSAVPGLRFLLLGGNRLSALQSDAFAGLSELRELDLSNNALVELPYGVLSGLSELGNLRLDGNALEALPEGMFSGASSLRSVRLDGNPGAPFALRAELRRTDAPLSEKGPATIQATLASGAPFDVELSLEATGGGFRSAEGSVSEEVQVPLAAGETASAELVVVASEAGAVRVSLSVGPVPGAVCDGLPCWRGLALEAGDPLVLFAAPPTAADTIPTPEPLFGEDLRLPLASLVTAGGLPVARWQATSSNPTVAAASIKGDELLVATEPGVEGVAGIEVVATDAMGQSVTVRFEVQVAFYWPSSPRWLLSLPVAGD